MDSAAFGEFVIDRKTGGNIASEINVSGDFDAG